MAAPTAPTSRVPVAPAGQRRADELTAARARAVQAADAERRRIGRDLHDGAQQRLIAIGHWLRLAERALESDPERAAALLAEAREQATAACQELRELARGLHPVALDHGLGPALAALAMQSPVPLRVGELPDDRLPEVVETTAWFIVSEAISNAVKHAGASEVTVAVTGGARSATIAVADDGSGGACAATGTGLRGLADRVESLGGEFTLVSPPGAGTRLEATLPLAPLRPSRDPVLEFGHPGDGGVGERLIDQILDGSKTASVSLLREWELEGGAPRIGGRLPVLDHTGAQRALVEVTRIAVVPFGAIGADVVRAEGGYDDAETWRAAQRRFYDSCREEIAIALDEPGWRLSDEEPMVVTWFRLPAAPRPDTGSGATSISGSSSAAPPAGAPSG